MDPASCIYCLGVIDSLLLVSGPHIGDLMMIEKFSKVQISHNVDAYVHPRASGIHIAVALHFASGGWDPQGAAQVAGVR